MRTKQPESLHTIAFSDCDPFGHLNNGRYIDYFLNARELHLNQFYDFSIAQYTTTGNAWVVTRNQLAYHRPARYAEQVHMLSRLLYYNEYELHLEMVMTNAAREHLKSMYWAKFAHVDARTGKRAPHPASFLQLCTEIVYEEAACERENFEARVQQLSASFIPAKT